ncbi:MAG: aminotransferase class I/II-fold pyridoxal phosphate-dependent enzyme, partial [Synergistaceae bacterium]|nr:aminotransferase class I/II-fold pyridoxal phosphate-dependent enzyme [Synergistaceae bacterium]
MDQNSAPLHEALERYRGNRVVPFDVPGHKQGRGTPELTEFLGRQCLSVDVNSMKPLDNLSHPTSVIRDAEALAAEAFGAQRAFFMVGGTTSAVQAMIMSVCKSGDSIIIPRNVHKSAINALILCGVNPVYVDPGVHSDLGISLGMTPSGVEAAVRANPSAKAVFVNNPTYYGICPDMEKITNIAHSAGMAVLADEAHGTHFYFGDDMPLPAIRAGADMSAISMHKTGGSLTQSSLLLAGGGRVSPDYVRTIINLTQTTSASYLLMSSIDIARKT